MMREKDIKKQEKYLEYRPYGIGRVILLIEGSLCFALAFVILGLFSQYYLISAGTCIFLIVSLIWCYKKERYTIIFEEDGLRLLNTRDLPYYHVSWDKFSYAYYCRHWHDGIFVVLSPEPMEQKKAKRIVNRTNDYMKLRKDNVVVLRVGNTKYFPEIKKMIGKKVPNVYVMNDVAGFYDR